jgi:hypothetical protein
MLVPAREKTINLSQDGVGFVRARVSAAVAFLQSEVGRVPFVGIGVVRPSAAVDLLAGVLLHPFGDGVGTGRGVPVTGVDEDLVGWEGHFGGVVVAG